MKVRDLIVLGAGLVLALFILFLSVNGMLRIVMTNSMAPTYRAGDVILLRMHPQDVQPGMVISFEQNNRLITHRVVGVEDGEYITQGDNSSSPDPWRVAPFSVVGAPVLRLPYLGHVITFVRQPAGWFLLVILPAILIVAGEVRTIYRKSRQSDEVSLLEEDM